EVDSRLQQAPRAVAAGETGRLRGSVRWLLDEAVLARYGAQAVWREVGVGNPLRQRGQPTVNRPVFPKPKKRAAVRWHKLVGREERGRGFLSEADHGDRRSHLHPRYPADALHLVECDTTVVIGEKAGAHQAVRDLQCAS